MAKQIDDCLFCECNPCTCNKPAKPVKPTKPTAKCRPTVGPVHRESEATDNGRDAVATESVPTHRQAKRPVKLPPRKPASLPVADRTITQPRVRPDLSKITNIRSEEEEEFRRAVTIVCTVFDCLPVDLENSRQYIDLPSWKIDAIRWREGRRRGKD